MAQGVREQAVAQQGGDENGTTNRTSSVMDAGGHLRACVRAGRLIAMLLTLQQRGRMTAAQLAEQLEVSQRTVLRDVEALSEAGLPIFTTQGSGGAPCPIASARRRSAWTGGCARPRRPPRSHS